MSISDPFRTYFRELQKNLSTGAATEQTHRSALKALLEALGDGVLAINEPKRVECGAPDYIITRAKTPIGYVEAKDVGTSLDTNDEYPCCGKARGHRASISMAPKAGHAPKVRGGRDAKPLTGRNNIGPVTLTRDMSYCTPPAQERCEGL